MAVQKSKVTIFDVAKASGVSSSAVSYALNGKSGVSEDTRAKVLKIAHELGWKPNGAAQALAKSKTQRIGLVLGYDPKLLAVESYMMELISGLGAELEKHDYSLLVRMAVGEHAKPMRDLARGAHRDAGACHRGRIRIRQSTDAVERRRRRRASGGTVSV